MTIFDKAIVFATEKHSGKTRKKSALPYIIHPLEAAVIAATMTDDEEVLAAAVLHDTVEDTDATIKDIKKHFGARIASLVASETENKRKGIDPKNSWTIRKEETLQELKESDDPAVKIVWLSDKLANMRAVYRAWKTEGNNVWSSFHQSDPARQAWYYRTACDLLSELKEHDAWIEYRDIVETVFADIKAE